MLSDFLKDYLSIIIFLIIALGLSVAFIVLNFILSPKKMAIIFLKAEI